MAKDAKITETVDIPMTGTSRELDAQGARNILNSFTKLEKAGVEYENVVVSSVSRINGKTGKPFIYPESKQAYAIINLKATNLHKLGNAVELFKNKQYQEACNQNVSVNYPLERAGEVGFAGTVVCDHIPLKDKDTGEFTGETALLPIKFIPNAKERGTKVNLDEIMVEETPATEA